ncbi:hypothetical protein [Caproiciproducens sp. NJN-50]|uniref:hypothetical protein n=1 Tax=Caproiciproducens sp. NJN-50 TaxID=2507162 RepID=UPI001FAA6789|nr:hypothetical protein [Caproiciproducens sp. NJN-50]
MPVEQCLGLNPRSLVKNIPNKSEPWKVPVSIWLHEIDEKRRKKTEQKQKRKAKAAAARNDGSDTK